MYWTVEALAGVALLSFDMFILALGVVHSFDRDEETRAAPVTPFFLIISAAMPFLFLAVLVLGLAAGLPLESVWYQLNGMTVSRGRLFNLPFTVGAWGMIAAAMAVPAFYKAGHILGLYVQERRLPKLRAHERIRRELEKMLLKERLKVRRLINRKAGLEDKLVELELRVLELEEQLKGDGKRERRPREKFEPILVEVTSLDEVLDP